MLRFLSTLLLSGLFSVLFIGSARAQLLGNANASLLGQNQAERLNTITTAVPFLMITPDARAAGMGNTGVSRSPDRNAAHWNPAQTVFIDRKGGVGASYVPWLQKLTPDNHLLHASGYYKFNNKEAVGASAKYFTLGELPFTNRRGQTIGTITPREYMAGVHYSRKLGERFSAGIAAKYIRSDLLGGVRISGQSTSPGESIAADLAFFYRNDELDVGQGASFNFGLNISNIGPKIRYRSNSEGDFIPTNLRLGPTLNLQASEEHRIEFSTDLNKLLVPTPPIYDPNDSDRIIAGRDPDRSVPAGIFGSFTDAPGRPVQDPEGDIVFRNDGSGRAEIEDGSRFNEELREVTISTGIEYEMYRQFKLRAGYFYEHPSKGGREFMTLGTGVRYKFFSLDLSYFHAFGEQDPLDQTVRISIGADFGEG